MVKSGIANIRSIPAFLPDHKECSMFRPRWWQLTHRHPKRLPRRGRLAAGASLHRPLRIEALEYRLAPATHTWTGAADTLWSNNANLMEGAPTSAEMNIVLVFPAVSGPSTSSANDISGLTVQSITFTGSGYTISGSAITL